MRTRIRVACAAVAAIAVASLVTAPASAAGTQAPTPVRAPLRVLEAGEHGPTSFVAPARDVGRRQSSAFTPAQFSVTYTGFGAFPEAQAAFQHAVDLWSQIISTPHPIKVRASFASAAPSNLGSAGSYYVWWDFPGAPHPNTYFPDALADVFYGDDLCNAAACDADAADIVANFNSNRSDWYFGTDGNPPPGKYDFVSVVMHEIGHGLGINGSMQVTGDIGTYGYDDTYPYPAIFDRWAENAAGQLLITRPNNSTELGSTLRSGNVRFDSPLVTRANGGVAPKLYAPATWAPGSSFSHFDETAFARGNFNSLMTPFLGGGEAIHDPGPVGRALFETLGWSVSNYPNRGRPDADFDADGDSDATVFRPSTGTWHVRGVGNTQYGAAGDFPLKGDFNGDGKNDYALFRPSSGTWHVLGLATTQFGTNGDIPMPGDYDGDGTTDIAVFRPSTRTWHVRGASTVTYGGAGDIPVVGDFNGDGVSDIAVFRPSTGTWHIRNIANIQYGTNGDRPVAADYDGDGVTDLAVFRPSLGRWYVRNIVSTVWGSDGDIPVPGDYDDDDVTDIAVFRPSTGAWHVRNVGTFTWGTNGDRPVNAGHIPA